MTKDGGGPESATRTARAKNIASASAIAARVSAFGTLYFPC